MDREYEIEHFGFTAEQVSLERNNFLQKIIRTALDSMVNKLNAKDETLHHLQKAKEDVLQNIWSSMSTEIESIVSMDKKYFTIPDHVLLPADFDHVKTYTELDEQNLDTKLEKLKNSFLENALMLANLHLENSQYTDIRSFLDAEVGIQKQLQEAFDNINKKTVNAIVHKIENLKKTNVNN